MAVQSYGGAAKNVNWTITPGVTRFPVDCTAAGCAPSAIVMASRYAGDPSVTVFLATPGERFLPRNTQLDFGIKRNFKLNGVGRRLQLEFNVTT